MQGRTGTEAGKERTRRDTQGAKDAPEAVAEDPLDERKGSGEQIAVLTVATDDYVPGVMVMVHSFLKHHPRFGGEVVVVHDGLSAAARGILAGAFKPLRFEPVGNVLKERVERVCRARPEIEHRKAAFYLLEAFRLTGYRKILCCDADLLFRAGVGELFDAPQALLCCRDRFALRGLARDAVTYRPVEGTPGVGVAGTLTGTFNSGFLVVDRRLVGKDVHEALLARVSPDTWNGVEALGVDQLVLNRHFAGRATLLGSTYNYPVDCAADVRAREGIGLEDAKVLHFKLPMKPWRPDAMLYWARAEAALAFPPGYTLWYEAYVDCLAGLRLRNGVRQARAVRQARGVNGAA